MHGSPLVLKDSLVHYNFLEHNVKVMFMVELVAIIT